LGSTRVRFAEAALSSGRFTRYGGRLDIYIDFLALAAAAAEKLTAEEKERGGNNYDKNHEYGHDCRAAPTAIVISHKIHPPLCTGDSIFVDDVIVFDDCRRIRYP
jgi:hypothetical protein